MMAVRRRKRMTPLEDAIEHVKKAQDKTAELEVKYINSYKGRGVFAQSHFFKGDFVVEYRGELISSDEALRRRMIYHTKCAVFMFDFHWNEKTWSIDAAQENGSLGRLVNDDHRNPNCRMKRIMEVAEPHLCLFALRDIQPGEEITYDYGGNDWPWRKQTEDLPQAAKSSEATFSRPAEIAKSSTILQTEDQTKVSKSSKSKSSRPAETTPESPPSTVVQTEDRTKVKKSSKSNSSRPAETAPESPSSTIVQTEDQTKVSKSSKSKSSRPAETTPESPPSTVVQTEDQTKVSKSSKSKSSRPAETTPESPPSTIVQTEDRTKVKKSSKSNSSRPAETAPESPSSTIVQTEDQTKVSKSSKSKSSRPAETTPESPPSTVVQTEDQTKVSKSSKSKSSRPAETTPESPPSTIVQTEDRTKVKKSSKSNSSRPAETAPESPSSTIVQTEDQTKVSKSSKSKSSRPAETTPESPPSTVVQTEDQTKVSKSSKSKSSRPAETTPESPPSTIVQTEDRTKVKKSSKSNSSRPAETAPESPSSTIVQTEDQTKVSKSSKSKSSRPAETAPESPPSAVVKTEDQTKVKKSSKSNSSRPAETAPESPSSTIVQTEDQPRAGKSSKSKSSRPAEPPPSTIVQTPQKWSPSSSDCDLPPPDHSTPRLRRTKSIQMRGRLDFESDELFDSTSDDSGEEFIPKSGQDSSEDTDSSYIASFDQKMKKMRFPSTRQMVDTGEWYESLKELDSTSLKPTTERARSPARKRSKSCKRSSNGASRSTQMGSLNTTKQKGGATGPMLENSESDPEQNLADKDSSLDRTADNSLFIPAVCKKDDGSRIYNKKQYCLYCKLGVIKMARHLERAHQDKPEVAKAVSFPKHSKERRMHMEYLRNKGNFAHNVEVMNSGVGSLVPRQQPKDKAQAGNFLHCAYCQGLFTRKVLWRHFKLCKFRPSIPLKPGRTRIQALCSFAVPPPSGVKEHLWKLLSNMVQDDVFHAVKSDACIIEYGEHLYNRLGYDPSKHEYIRQKLRELGRLLVCSRQTTNLRTIEDHNQPANFMHVVKAVKALARYSSEKHTFDCPSLALKIGYSLKKVSMLVESRANVQGDISAAKDAQIFRSVYDARWNELISSSSLRTLQESKWNIPQLLPFTKDIQRLHSYLDVEQQDLSCKLSSDASLQTYRQLAQVILAQVVMFNRRRAGEVSKIPLSAYTSPNVSDPQEDVNAGLSDLEKRLCQYFRRIEIRGKRGRKVPVLLTPAVQQALDLLISKREECDVLTENVYLFARPSSLTYYHGSDCPRYFAKVCGAKSPESLTSTKLRKQTATLSQVLNLSNTELDQLADFLGHDIRVHRHFYRLPEGTLRLAKISKILMALEQGRLAEFKGKSLDDINVDPEENVYFDSDQEGDPGDSCESANESDSLDHPVTTKETETDVNTSQVSTVTSTEATDSRHKRQTQLKRLKGRQPSQRQKWNEDEIAAVERHLMSFITSCRVPGKRDCDNCINMETTALKNRNWLAVKFYVKNRITSLKRKV